MTARKALGSVSANKLSFAVQLTSSVNPISSRSLRPNSRRPLCRTYQTYPRPPLKTTVLRRKRSPSIPSRVVARKKKTWLLRRNINSNLLSRTNRCWKKFRSTTMTSNQIQLRTSKSRKTNSNQVKIFATKFPQLIVPTFPPTIPP